MSTMRLPIRHLPIVAGALLAACSSSGANHDAGTGNDATTGNDGGATLTCDWLTGNDNCWKTTAGMAAGCLPPETESGTLSADNAICVYASGVSVTFTPPIVLPPPDDITWNFTVVGANGQPCLHFEDTPSNGLKLVVGGQTVDETTTTGLDLNLTCPDGMTYTAPNAFDLLACPMAFDGLPGLVWSASGTSLSVTMVGAPGGSLPLFDCVKN